MGAVRLGPVIREAEASHEQRLLWMIDHHRSASGCLNYPLLLRLTGMLDRGRLSDALRSIVARHESLRTTYERRRGRLVQRIHEPGDVDLAEAGSAADVDREIATPINTRQEIMRCSLWPESSGDHILCVNVHHLSTDAISTQVIVDELAALLSGVPLPRVAWQFRHATEWQRRRQAAGGDAAAYWSRQLAGAVPLPLPSAAATQAGPQGAVAMSLRPQRLAGLRTYAQAHQTTLFAVLVAAYATALAHHFGVADVAVASPFANRLRTEMLRTVGFFANLVVLRVRSLDSFDSTVADTARVLQEARAHQHFSYTQLPGTGGLENAVFQLLPGLPAAIQCAGLTMRVMPPRVASRFPLEMTLIEHDGELTGLVQFAPDRLDMDRARSIAAAFQSVVERAAAG